MNCTHVNLRTVLIILISFLLMNIQHIQMAADNINQVDKPRKDSLLSQKVATNSDEVYARHEEDTCQYLNGNCKEMPLNCMNCSYTHECVYGQMTNVTCEIITKSANCKGPKIFQKSFICRFCYQTEPWEQQCVMKASCDSVSTPRAHYTTNCTVNSDVMCIGKRKFHKNIHCNWTGGYKWSTALILSVTLGGFGADRFYLGHWREGIGKLFSFGGLGVWTLIDVILISLHYLGPADGSLYI